ncbi:hypothetical protein [Gemmatimonas sp.]|jgi:hypothetical protein|uniref:hypothetical protein n=1 Tax=Gemmatimonas sp. TaxID=1962908 RepID=UPI0037C059E0
MMKPSQTVTVQILTHVLKRPGLPTSRIAAHMSEEIAVQPLSAFCSDLARRGLLRREFGPPTAQTGSKRTAYWYPTDRLLTEGVEAVTRLQVTQLVLQVLEERGATSMSDLSELTGRPWKSIKWAVLRLERQGKAERFDERGQRLLRVPTPPLEDDGWEPQPWVSSIRARSLSLTTTHSR